MECTATTCDLLSVAQQLLEAMAVLVWLVAFLCGLTLWRVLCSAW